MSRQTQIFLSLPHARANETCVAPSGARPGGGVVWRNVRGWGGGGYDRVMCGRGCRARGRASRHTVFFSPFFWFWRVGGVLSGPRRV